MKRRTRFLFLLLLSAVVSGGTIFILSSAARAAVYLSFYRTWHATWPVAAGKRLPENLFPYFGLTSPVWVEVEPGVTMRLDPADLVPRAILVNRTWEASTTQELMRRLPAGGTFVDVGAHIGWYTLKAAKVVGPKGRVIAVEPNRETLLQLRQNIAASGVGSIVTVAPVACSDSETTLTFYAAGRQNTGKSSLSAANASGGSDIPASYLVRARRLDDIVKETAVSRVDEIKIDVEGAELLVLKGATGTLDRHRPVVAVEVNDSLLKTMGSSAAELIAFLHSHRYESAGRYEENMIFLPLP